MAKLTAQEVAGVVRAIGAPSGTTVAEWIEKAYQESKFDSEIEDFLHSGHWGLFQISEQHIGKAGTTSVADLKVPVKNFQVAKVLYGESGWRPWAASGGKPNPRAEFVAAANDPSLGAIPLEGHEPIGVLDDLENVAGDTAAAIRTGVQVLTDAGKWLTDTHNIARILYVTGGIVLGIVAISIVAKPVVSDVAKTVSPI